MSKFTIDAKIIRAAQQNVAKQDVRYYLNGIFIGVNGDVVGTDGNTLFKSVHTWTVDDDAIDSDLIIHISGTIPKSAISCTFDTCTKLVQVKTARDMKVFTIELVDGKFVDYKRVIPEKTRLPGLTPDGVGFNGELMGRTAVLGSQVCYRFGEADGVGSALLATPYDYVNSKGERYPSGWVDGTCMVVMPTRMQVM